MVVDARVDALRRPGDKRSTSRRPSGAAIAVIQWSVPEAATAVIDCRAGGIHEQDR